MDDGCNLCGFGASTMTPQNHLGSTEAEGDLGGIHLYSMRTILMDGGFKKIKPLLPTLECNTMAANEHVRDEAHNLDAKQTVT